MAALLDVTVGGVASSSSESVSEEDEEELESEEESSELELSGDTGKATPAGVIAANSADMHNSFDMASAASSPLATSFSSADESDSLSLDSSLSLPSLDSVSISMSSFALTLLNQLPSSTSEDLQADPDLDAPQTFCNSPA